MKTAAFFLLGLFPAFLHSQEGSNIAYDWDVDPTVYVPEASELNEDVITVFEKHVHEFTIVKSNISRFELMHVKKHLLSDKAIEKENKFYVWTNGSTKIYRLKARVIQPSGKVVELNEDNIIESKGDDGKVRYRYFVFEGIEKGSTIEYLHYICYKADPDAAGGFKSYHYFDINGPEKKKRIDLSVTVDNTLSFSAYCTLPRQPLVSTSTKKQDTWQLSLENVAGIPAERYAHRSKSQYRLFYNVVSHNTYSAYDYLARGINNRFAQPGLSDTKAFAGWRDAFLGEFLSASDSTNLLKLRAIERGLKTRFSLTENASAISWKTSQNQPIDEATLFALMIHLSRNFGIEHRIVLTCDVRELLFAEKYQSYVFLDIPMIHFPTEDVYFLPDPATRIGPAPYYCLDNRSLAVKPDNLYSSLMPPANEIVRISMPTADYSADLIRTVVTIDSATLQATIGLDRSVSGYFAEPYQAEMSYLTEEQLREVKERFFTYVLSESAQLGDYTFENDRSADFNDKPLKGHVTATSSTLVSQAGDKLLVNIGTLIGPQSNMYQEKPETRQLPVDLDYLHRYKREIRLAIPEGYQVANIGDFNRSITPDAENNSIGFTSSCEVLGNELVITVEEWYNQLTYPKEQYGYVVDAFNAAADFNKLVLVLEQP